MRYFGIIIGMCCILLIFWKTSGTVQKVKEEERLKMDLWAKTQKRISEVSDIDLLLINFIEDLGKVPMILVDEEENILDFRNIKETDSISVYRKLKVIKNKNKPIIINYQDINNYLYYDNSSLLKDLQYYPLVMFIIIIVFLTISWLFFRSNKRAEQNSLWSGMAKETAHQIGTPLTSIFGWIDLLKEKIKSNFILDNIHQDTQKLKIISDRFAEIGTQPNLKPTNIVTAVKEITEYMKERISKEVSINFLSSKKQIKVNINVSIFSWAIENLIKNGIDAMNGAGTISIEIKDSASGVSLTLKDTGEGISKKHWKKIFKAGFSTKDKGWGMGLSLTKRIIENYHKGKIRVINSVLKKGTTFEIILKK